ncbi:phosphotransferase family protein [Oceanobacillus sp. J11TS1]|uniref:phosphotransferase family protein n=1 Tax=Oceanobacillus sp. J11TS1 TaxID=2807191 RepID=UPI001B1B2870|nr:aminoglycoside phosphotransferase family protein [Oceanobacillus sp. J11TS1]GIO23295.1 hypothetical protein J11TS1_18760 [Oceanobacillus sp. J11TS1]
MIYIPEKLEQWILSHFLNEASIHSIRPLKGSTTALMYEIGLVLTSGENMKLVLRQYERSTFTEKDIEQETDSLRMATQLTVPTPQWIGADPDGEVIGKPLLLMSKVEGAVNILPTNQTAWLDELAKTLAHLHDNRITDFPWKYGRYQKAGEMDIPFWSDKPEVWRALKEIISRPEPSYTPIFIHRDFHPTNVLWEGTKVSGVVDWTNGCLGPAGIDVGHCRWNLAMLYGVEAAETFLIAYQGKTKTQFSYDVYWDIVSLMDVLEGQPEVYSGWEVFGKTDITVEVMMKRMDSYARSLLEK